VQKDRAQVGLQVPDGAAQGRLGHVQTVGGPPEVAFLVRSIEPGEFWGWCYLDDIVLPPAQRTQPSASSDGTSGTGKGNAGMT
jgi:hypothetical protein